VASRNRGGDDSLGGVGSRDPAGSPDEADTRGVRSAAPVDRRLLAVRRLLWGHRLFSDRHQLWGHRPLSARRRHRP